MRDMLAEMKAERELAGKSVVEFPCYETHMLIRALDVAIGLAEARDRIAAKAGNPQDGEGHDEEIGYTHHEIARIAREALAAAQAAWEGK